MPGYQNLQNFPGNVQSAGTSSAITTITVVSPSPTNTIPAGTLVAGSTYRVTAFGRYTSSATAGTATFTLNVGTNSWASAATSYTASLTNAQWRVEFEFTIRTVGSTGTAWGAGKGFIGTAVATLGSAFAIPGAANAAVTVDTTANANVTLSITSSASQTYVCDVFMVENLSTVA